MPRHCMLIWLQPAFASVWSRQAFAAKGGSVALRIVNGMEDMITSMDSIKVRDRRSVTVVMLW